MIATRRGQEMSDPTGNHQNTMISSLTSQQHLAVSDLITENSIPPTAIRESSITGVKENNEQCKSEPDFPYDIFLAALDKNVSSISFKQVKCLLKASIDMYKKGIDVQNEACQHFLQEGLTIFMKKVNSDELDSSKLNNDNTFYAICQLVVELCVLKLDKDCFSFLDLLAEVLNPKSRFHILNAVQTSKTVTTGSNVLYEEIYAMPPSDTEYLYGWLVDLINKFGSLNGFEILLQQFSSGQNLTMPVIYALIKPFGLCSELLTTKTIQKYLMPIVQMVPQMLDNLTDTELKKEFNNESKNDIISDIIKEASCLASRLPDQKEIIKSLECVRPKLIMRLLQNSTLNEEMNNYNKVNNVIARLNYLHLLKNPFEEEWSTAECMEVLLLFWNLAHFDEVSTEIMDKALNAHIQTLNILCSQEREAQITIWLDKCVEELRVGNKWTLPALKLIHQIYYSLYESHDRKEIIERLQNQHSVVVLVINNLTAYMDKVRQLVKELPDTIDPNIYTTDGRYNHIFQVQERLNFLRCFLRDGQLWLCLEQAKQIWQCLAEQAVFDSDREACFKWFSDSVGDDSDLDSATMKDIFINTMLRLDSRLLTESGINCFERFFNAVNENDNELKLDRPTPLTDNVDLIEMDYFTRVLVLLWNFTHFAEVSTEIMNKALNSHVRILGAVCSQEREAQITIWLDKCVEELKVGNKWTLPALKLIHEIYYSLYEPSCRNEVIERLQNQHSVVVLVINNLTTYMDKVRLLVKEYPDIDPNIYTTDGHYNHILQVQERLNFLRCFLRDGELWLCLEQAKQIWQCLVEQAVFDSDRETCFEWFSDSVGDDSDLDPATIKDIFINNMLRLDPTLLTESGINCVEKFFNAVNENENELKLDEPTPLLNNVDSIEIDYLTQVLTFLWNLAHSDEVSTEIVNLALNAHAKILVCASSQEQDTQTTIWVGKCIEELKSDDKWTLPALRLIDQIYYNLCKLLCGKVVIERLQNEHSVVKNVTDNFITYMNKVRQLVKEYPYIDPNTYTIDGRYNHIKQVEIRLHFLKCSFLQKGQLYHCLEQAKEIWQCLAEQAVFDSDRETCFKWFSSLMGNEPTLTLH